MIRATLFLALALVMVAPVAAGERIVLSGVLESASAVSVQTETVTPSGTMQTECLGHKAVVSLGPDRRAVLDFDGALTPDGGVLIRNRGGSEVLAYPGDTVRVLAAFACAQPSEDERAMIWRAVEAGYQVQDA